MDDEMPVLDTGQQQAVFDRIMHDVRARLAEKTGRARPPAQDRLQEVVTQSLTSTGLRSSSHSAGRSNAAGR